MIAVFKRFNLLGKTGIIVGLLGGLAGMIAAIYVNPLFGIVFSGLMIAIVYFSLRIAFGSVIRQEELMKSGVQAEATILEVKETGMTVNKIYPMIKLVLEVRPPKGETYRVETKELINRFDIPTFQPGTVLPVLYDPRNPKKLAVGTREDLAARGVTGLPAATAPDAVEQDAERVRMAQEFIEKEVKEREEVRRHGKPASAKILVATPLGINVNGNNPAMSFLLEVHPDRGPAFQAQATGVIAEESVSRYQPGREIYVKYDPEDKTRVSLDHS